MSNVLKELIEQWLQAETGTVRVETNELTEELAEVKGYIPRPLKGEFKALCAQKQVKMRQVLHHLIEEWVNTVEESRSS